MNGRELRAKLAESEDSYRRAERQIQNLQTRYSQLQRELFESELKRSAADERADKMADLVATLAAQLGRQPEVVVESILTGITPLFLGYKDGPRNSIDETQSPITPDDVPDSRGFFPEVEFDPFMESEDAWPDHPSSMSTTPSSPPRDLTKTNGLTSHRPPNETPFTSGSGATSPPGNVVE